MLEIGIFLDILCHSRVVYILDWKFECLGFEPPRDTKCLLTLLI